MTKGPGNTPAGRFVTRPRPSGGADTASGDPRAERRRRLAEPDLTQAAFCDGTGTPGQSTRQGELAWTACQVERRRCGGTGEDPFEAYNPFRQGR